MRKFLFTVVMLLALASLSFAQVVNDGIRTRTKWKPFTLTDQDTASAVFQLESISEQGFATLCLKLADATDTVDAWFSSGCVISFFGGTDTVWSGEVQCVFTESFSAATTFGPLNLSFIQSEALVDTSDRKTGYMPADYLRIRVVKGDIVAPDTTTGIAKVWFK